ncbi:unnamed protein product [Mytilus edulis]|uniref:SWIM-type domain-containing protein n=1 Tax=Mytilus edulis TaxID=6550 RepID=A0A8S3UWR3_MYTED|nr:unnamed protein product [Mytilus edulis]
MSDLINNFCLPELHNYPEARGVTVSGKDSVFNDIRGKLKKASLQKKNPLELPGQTSDFTYVPDFGLIDIFNYMIFNESEYDGKKLKGISDTSDVCLFKGEVTPTCTQRDKTYLTKKCYDLWFVLDKEDGSVGTGHCECIGGADGACRHLAAALYGLEAFKMKSSTDGENQWVKRPRHHDVPVPVHYLNVVRAKYHQVGNNMMKPHSDLYDSRAEQHRHQISDDQKRGIWT